MIKLEPIEAEVMCSNNKLNLLFFVPPPPAQILVRELDTFLNSRLAEKFRCHARAKAQLYSYGRAGHDRKTSVTRHFSQLHLTLTGRSHCFPVCRKWKLYPSLYLQLRPKVCMRKYLFFVLSDDVDKVNASSYAPQALRNELST